MCYFCCLNDFKCSNSCYRRPFDSPCGLNFGNIFFLKTSKHGFEQKQKYFAVSRGVAVLKNSTRPQSCLNLCYSNKASASCGNIRSPNRQPSMCFRLHSGSDSLLPQDPKGIKGKSNILSYHYKPCANTPRGQSLSWAQYKELFVLATSLQQVEPTVASCAPRSFVLRASFTGGG